VLAAHAAGELDVAGGDRVDDRLVGLRHDCHVDVERDHRHRRVVGDPKAAPHRLQQPVVARLDDQPVKALAVLDDALDVAARRRVGHPVDLGLQPRDVAAQTGRGQPRGELLERGADVEELEHSALPRVAHVGAAVRHAADEAEHLELAQRLADRALARPVLAGDVHLDEAIAGPDLPFQDGPHDAVSHVVAQRATSGVHLDNVLRSGFMKKERTPCHAP